MSKKKSSKISNKAIIIGIIVTILIIATGIFKTVKTDDGNLYDTLLERSDVKYDSIADLLDSDAAKQPLNVNFIDVDQGDCTLIRFNGYSVLIDSGKSEFEDNVYRYLKACNINKLDLIIGTHPDSDHIGGFYDLFNGGIKCDLFIWPQVNESIKKTATETKLINILRTMKIKTEYAVCGKEYAFGDMKLTTYVTEQLSDDKNDYSVVTKIEYMDSSYLFTGDAGSNIEKELMGKNYPLEADIMKIGHHGSYKSTSNAFLDYVKPSAAIISCGKDNSYGHPHKEVLKRLSKHKIPYYRTDEEGCIIIGTDGNKYYSAVQTPIK